MSRTTRGSSTVEPVVLQAGDSVSALWEGEEGEMWFKAVLKRVIPPGESLNGEIQYEVLFAKDLSGKRELRVVNKCQKSGQGRPLEVHVAQPRTPQKQPIPNGINSNHGVSTVVQPKNGKDNKEDDEKKNGKRKLDHGNDVVYNKSQKSGEGTPVEIAIESTARRFPLPSSNPVFRRHASGGMEAVDVSGAWVQCKLPKVVSTGSEDDDDDDGKSDDDDDDDDESDERDEEEEDAVKSAQPRGTVSKRYRTEEENLKIQSLTQNADGEPRFDEVSATTHISYLVQQKKDVYAIPLLSETGDISFGSTAQRKRQKEGTVKLGQLQAERGVTGKGNLGLTGLFAANSIMHSLLGFPFFAILRNEVGSSKLYNSTEAAGSRVGEYSVPFVLMQNDDGSKKVATFSDHRVHDHAPSTLSVSFNAIVLHL